MPTFAPARAFRCRCRSFARLKTALSTASLRTHGAVGALREEVVPLRACEVAVCDAAGLGFPGGRVEVPDHAGAVVEDRDRTLAVGECVAPAAGFGAGQGRADESAGGDVP